LAQYRTQLRIIADVLSTARDMNSEGNGVGVTTLLRKGNMSYSRMTKLLSELVGYGLLLELAGDRI
jgi:predicted transcriptional regulator